MTERQRTIRAFVQASGVGLVSGQKASFAIGPAAPDAGVVFLVPSGEIHVSAAHVTNDGPRAVVLSGPKARVGSVEHLLAALSGTGVTNARVEVDGDEIPFGDAVDASLFVAMIRAAGIREQGSRVDAVVVPPKFELRRDGSRARATPMSDELARAGLLSVQIEIEFPAPIGSQTAGCTLRSDGDFDAFADARSFMRSALDFIWPDGESSEGKIHGSLKGLPRAGLGAIQTFRQDGSWVDAPRRRHEAARHKVVDLIGDLALLGRTVVGGIEVKRPGHAFNLEIVKSLRAQAG